ncbi:MAG: four helix bundle protein [Bacteroidaceae bacterium]|nr:four helix bundle protein [Bacteroidaceae bacterium]
MTENVDFSFERLNVHQAVRVLIKDVYMAQKQLPKEETYALGDQIRRAAISVSSNIAEGSGRSSWREKIHFIEISYGSLMELHSQIQLCADLGYMDLATQASLREQIINVAKMLSGLKTSFEKHLSPLTNNQ